MLCYAMLCYAMPRCTMTNLLKMPCTGILYQSPTLSQLPTCTHDKVQNISQPSISPTSYLHTVLIYFYNNNNNGCISIKLLTLPSWLRCDVTFLVLAYFGLRRKFFRTSATLLGLLSGLPSGLPSGLQH
jgi:hypothetical protein